MFEKQKKFSIRKLSVGVASVAIASLMLGVSNDAYAEEVTPATEEVTVDEISLEEAESLENTESVFEETEEAVEEKTEAEKEVEFFEEVEKYSYEGIQPASAEMKEGSNTLDFTVTSDSNTTTSTKEIETDAFMIFGASDGMREYNTEMQDLGRYVLDNTPQSMEFILMEYLTPNDISWEYSPLTNDRQKLKTVISSYENTDVYGLRPSVSSEQFPDAPAEVLSRLGDFGDTYKHDYHKNNRSEGKLAIIFDASENTDKFNRGLDEHFVKFAKENNMKVLPIIFGDPTEFKKIDALGELSEEAIYVKHDLAPIKEKLREILQKVTTKTVTSTPDVSISVNTTNDEVTIKDTILVKPDGSEEAVTLNGGSYKFKPTADGAYKFKYSFGGNLTKDATITSEVSVGGTKADGKTDNLTGLVVENTQETETEAIPFTREERKNPNLPVGETKVVQQGVNGVKTIYYNVRKENGAVVNKEKDREEVTTEPTPEITEVGTRHERERVETVPVPNKTVEKKTFDLMKGERKEIIGHLGIKTVVYNEVYDGDAKVSETVKSEEVTTQPVDTIILIGTKEIKERVETQPVPFKRIKKKTADLLVGQTRLFEGKEGVRTITHEDIFDDGNLHSTKVLKDEVTTAPVDEIEWIGVKEVKHRRETLPIAYEVERVETDELPLGEERIKQTGVNGFENVLYQEIWIDGKLVKTEEIKRERVSPIKEIIEVGTHVEDEECPMPEVIDPMPVGELPATGEAEMSLVFTGSSLAILSALGLVASTRKKENE